MQQSSKKYLPVVIFLTVAVLVIALFFLIRHIQNSKIDNSAAVISAFVVNLSNSDRANVGVKPLTVNPLLTEAAQLKANDMATKSYFGHVGPDKLSTAHWFSVVNYNYTYAGENLAVNFSESSDVEKAWLASPSHRSNILNSLFTDIGVAVAYGNLDGKPATFVVQMFGARN